MRIPSAPFANKKTRPRRGRVHHWLTGIGQVTSVSLIPGRSLRTFSTVFADRTKVERGLWSFATKGSKGREGVNGTWATSSGSAVSLFAFDLRILGPAIRFHEPA